MKHLRRTIRSAAFVLAFGAGTAYARPGDTVCTMVDTAIVQTVSANAVNALKPATYLVCSKGLNSNALVGLVHHCNYDDGIVYRIEEDGSRLTATVDPICKADLINFFLDTGFTANGCGSYVYSYR